MSPSTLKTRAKLLAHLRKESTRLARSAYSITATGSDLFDLARAAAHARGRSIVCNR